MDNTEAVSAKGTTIIIFLTCSYCVDFGCVRVIVTSLTRVIHPFRSDPLILNKKINVIEIVG